MRPPSLLLPVPPRLSFADGVVRGLDTAGPSLPFGLDALAEMLEAKGLAFLAGALDPDPAGVADRPHDNRPERGTAATDPRDDYSQRGSTWLETEETTAPRRR